LILSSINADADSTGADPWRHRRHWCRFANRARKILPVISWKHLGQYWVLSHLLPLPVGRLPGVGKVTEEKLKGFDVHTIADLRRLDLSALECRFGRYGVRLYELARGVDESKVVPDRPTQSISAEDTFEHDVPLAETEHMIRRLAQLTWAASRNERRIARTVTPSHTPLSPPSSCEELTAIALSLRERVALGPQQRFRLVGVGVSNFLDGHLGSTGSIRLSVKL
jgi:DNA polymerase-4